MLGNQTDSFHADALSRVARDLSDRLRAQFTRIQAMPPAHDKPAIVRVLHLLVSQLTAAIAASISPPRRLSYKLRICPPLPHLVAELLHGPLRSSSAGTTFREHEEKP